MALSSFDCAHTGAATRPRMSKATGIFFMANSV